MPGGKHTGGALTKSHRIDTHQDGPDPRADRHSTSTEPAVRRVRRAALAALSLWSLLVATSGVVHAAEPTGAPVPAYEGTVGGSPYGDMTISVSPPAFGGVLCHSGWDQVNVYVVPGNVGTYWTNVRYHNTITGTDVLPGWFATTSRADVGVVGPDPARWLTQATGTWLVYLQVGYYDASGQFQTTYNQWVPSYSNLLPGQVYIPLATIGTTCVVE
jgi:hypothetical protein